MRRTPAPLPYTPEQIKQANDVDLINYATLNGYELVKSDSKSLRVKNSGGLYFFMDSNRYYHHASEKTGGTIDFLMQYENMDFLQAVQHLINERPNIGEYKPPPAKPKKEREAMVLPDRAANIKRVYWYLCSVRGIDVEIISKLVGEKKIYQQAERGNCVFVGYDENKIPRYCSKRGTSTTRPFKGDQTNSNKRYPFAMEGISNRVYVFESPIDAMSHATLCKMQGIDYKHDHRISLGCVSGGALDWYLTQHSKIRQIIFALDNDMDGKNPDGTPSNHGQKAAEKFAAAYETLGYDTAIQTPTAKDFNMDLMEVKEALAADQVREDENEAEP